MTDDVEVAPSEATDEGVTETDQSEDITQDEQDEQAEAQAEGDAPDGGEPDDSDKDGPKSRHQRRKEAMERLRTEKAELEGKLARERERVQRLEAAMNGSAQPQESDFATYEEYTAALSGWHAMRQMDNRTKAEIEREAETHQREIERIEAEREREVAQGWQTQVAEAKARYQDFEKVAFTAPISEPVAQMIAAMDSGADVAYQLGLNPAEARRISSLSPIDAAMELGRLEARLSAPKPRTATQAPDPVSPVRPKASPTKDPSKMTMAEYAAARKAGKI